MIVVNTKKGFGILEIVVSTAIVSVAFFGILSVFQASLKLSSRNTHTIQAEFLIEEGIEAVRIMRDRGWANISDLATSTNHYIVFNGTTWATSTTNTYIDNFFERKFILSDIYRDSNDNIVDTPGTFDPDIRMVTVTVSWISNNATISKSITTILSDSSE